MATIKASSQTDLIDLTDGYSVILSSEAHTFTGDTDSVASTQTTTTTVMALCGSAQVPCTVGAITGVDGITAVSDGNTPAPIITVTATSALKTPGTLSIPVSIGDITINKSFSYSIAFKGGTGATGTPGKDGTNGTNGADALSLVIISSGGTIFKNTAIATTLTAHVYKGGAEVTGAALTALGTIKWYKDGATTAVATGQSLTVKAGDVASKANYTAQLEG